MRLLADTHVLLWAATGSDRLGDRAAALLSDSRNEVLFSAASIWEVATKAALGRHDFTMDAEALAEGLRANGWKELAVTSRHAAAIAHLPALHRDPFDRILIAQAGTERARLLTRDPLVAQYPGAIERI